MVPFASFSCLPFLSGHTVEVVVEMGRGVESCQKSCIEKVERQTQILTHHRAKR